VHLKGIKSDQSPVMSVSVEQVVKWRKGNVIWVMAMLHSSEDYVNPLPPPAIIQQVLVEFQDVFAEPKSLPPHREYDHDVSLVPGAVPITAKPYRYSPLHKDEIERQVKALPQSGSCCITVCCSNLGLNLPLRV
jgi:hypothetical protein